MKKAWSPITIGTLELSNRFVKSATFEGMYDDGIPNEKLIDHHVAMAKGGVGLTTVSYGAVSPEGRTFKNQMYIHERSLKELRKLAEAVHRAGGKVSMQLTHCGYFSKNTLIDKPLAPSRIFNEYGFLSGLMFSKAMTKDDLEKVAVDFATAAQRLEEIGFDAVEIHMGHGYLLSQFLSPATNKRKDKYGGCVENRTRFPLEVFKHVKEKVGKNMAVLVKLNLNDGFKGGFSLEDCLYVSKKLDSAGCDALVLSGGFTSKSPFYLLRGDIPLKGMIENGESFAEKLTMSLFGPLIIRKFPFTPLFFMQMAKEVRKFVQMKLVYLGGVNGMEDIELIMEAGFDMIALARPLIYDTDFLLKLERGVITETDCNRCNECIVEMDRGGVRCTQNNLAI